VVDAVRCAVEVQTAMIERNVDVPPEKRIEFRIGVHLGDVVEESDGDLMGDGVNIAARIEGIAKPGAICLSEDAYRQVKGRLDLKVSDLGLTQLKNIAEPVRVYSLEVGGQAPAKVATPSGPAGPSAARAPRKRSVLALSALAIALLLAAGAVAWHFASANRFPPIVSTPPAEAAHLSIVVLPFTNLSGDPSQDYFADGITENLTTDLSRLSGSFVIARNTPLPSRARMPTPGRSARSWASVTCWKVQCSAIRTAFGSAPSSSTPRLAVLSGRSVSTNLSPIYSICRTRSLPAWPANWPPS
jgi:adenylate cyclase